MADLMERVRLNRLMDVYGPLLTEHRREVTRLYCEEDLSLGEIAEQMGITRQGASDAMNKARIQLEEFEKKLGFAEQEAAYRKAAERSLKAIDSGRIEEARGELEQILKER